MVLSSSALVRVGHFFKLVSNKAAIFCIMNVWYLLAHMFKGGMYVTHLKDQDVSEVYIISIHTGDTSYPGV
jgi:hypothetical protein